MKKMVFALLAGATLFTACNNPSGSQVTSLETEMDSVSYALGQLIAKTNEERNWPALNAQAMAAAIDNYNNGGEEPLIADDMAEEILNSYSEQVMSKAGKDFLDSNKMAEGVVTTESGLQYRIIQKGEGPIPTSNDTVVCHYTGKLIDGRVFDSSLKRGTPAEFPVSRVIPGWTEALLMMPVGSKWEVFIPYELAYGSQDNGRIPPFSTLIFEMELLDIKK